MHNLCCSCRSGWRDTICQMPAAAHLIMAPMLSEYATLDTNAALQLLFRVCNNVVCHGQVTAALRRSTRPEGRQPIALRPPPALQLARRRTLASRLATRQSRQAIRWADCWPVSAVDLRVAGARMDMSQVSWRDIVVLMARVIRSSACRHRRATLLNRQATRPPQLPARPATRHRQPRRQQATR